MMATTEFDAPKSLRLESIRKARRIRLREPHISTLTEFVEQVREERECVDLVPYFDPADGGIEAECLFLLEAPGPQAVASGFVSRNNPDESAKNWHQANALAKLRRTRTASWSIIPWYIGDGGRIRTPRPADIDEGWSYLQVLLELLPRLRLIALVGRHAQAMHPRLVALRLPMVVMHTPHPSPQFVNRQPGNRDILNASVREIAIMLDRLRTT